MSEAALLSESGKDINHGGVLAASIAVAGGGVYCRVRLNRDTWHTAVVPLLREDGTRVFPGSTSVGQASDLMAKWGEHHTFLPDRSLTDHTQTHWRTHIPVTQLD